MLIKRIKNIFKRFFLRKFLITILVLFLMFFLILSIVSVFSIFFYASTKNFDCSVNGINNFINFVTNYKEIFIISFTLFGIYLVVVQIQQMSLTNKINLRNEWKDNLYETLKNIDKENLYLSQHIKLRAEDIFDFLFDIGFKFEQKYYLKKFFKRFFKNYIIDFERSAIENKYTNFKYYDIQLPYSLIHFRKIIDSLLRPSFKYKNFNDDFEKIYIDEFNRIKHTIASKSYEQ